VALTIRSADLREDRERIIETLRRYLTPLSDAARFDWLYGGNPNGQAAAWIALDERRGETVGVASAFPRRATLAGEAEHCWVLGDFCIHEQYRALGPALQLTRACLAAVDRGSVAFCLDFPSQSMMAIYRRLGIQAFGQMTRYVKVLSWKRRLEAAVSGRGTQALVGLLGTVVDRWPARRRGPVSGGTVTLEDRDCGAEFDELDRVNRDRASFYLDRSAAYLNWRYRRNPLGRHEILVARQDGQLQGYAILAPPGLHATIADLVAASDTTAALLLEEAARLLAARSVVTLSMPVSSSHPAIPLLLRSGFRPRESSPVIRYYRRGFEPKGTLSRDVWPILHGDRDS
jgi:hypothetical protein